MSFIQLPIQYYPSTAIGVEANTGPSADANTAVGYRALYATNNGANSAFGHEAGLNSNGSFNTFIGAQSGRSMISGQNNTFVGGFTGLLGGDDYRYENDSIILSEGAITGNPRLRWSKTFFKWYVDGSLVVKGNGGFGVIELPTQGSIRFYDNDSSNYVGFVAPTNVTSNALWNLPASDGTSGQVLSTNGANVLSWSSIGIGSGVNSIAFGTGSSASATSSIAIGTNSSSSASDAIAIGSNTASSGSTSIAIGRLSSASATGSSAIGRNSGATASVTITGAGSMALGGSYASGTDSFAAAVANNTSTYGATQSNAVAIGYLAKAQGLYAAAIGFTCSSTATRTYTFGDTCTASAAKGLAFGCDALSAFAGKQAYGNGAIAVSGDNQAGKTILKRRTTDATATALTSDNAAAGATNQVILANNTAFAFTGTIVARQQAAGGTASAAWSVSGLIRREGSAASTTLVASTVTVISNVPGWNLALSADTTNGGLAVTATGAVGTNVQWTATIDTTETTYA